MGQYETGHVEQRQSLAAGRGAEGLEEGEALGREGRGSGVRRGRDLETLGMEGGMVGLREVWTVGCGVWRTYMAASRALARSTSEALQTTHLWRGHTKSWAHAE